MVCSRCWSAPVVRILSAVSTAALIENECESAAGASAPPRAAAASQAVPRLSWGLKAQIAATLVGGTLLICSLVAGRLWQQPFFAALPAVLAVLLVGTPLVVAAARDLFQGKAGMNALVALAVIGALSTGQYLESAAVAFFMIVSSLIEKRTAAGAEASIESLIRLAPTKASRIIQPSHARSHGDEQEET